MEKLLMTSFAQPPRIKKTISLASSFQGPARMELSASKQSKSMVASLSFKHLRRHNLTGCPEMLSPRGSLISFSRWKKYHHGSLNTSRTPPPYVLRLIATSYVQTLSDVPTFVP